MEDLANHTNPKRIWSYELNFRILLKIPITVHTKITEKSTKECLKNKKFNSQLLQLPSFTYALVSSASVSHTFAIFSAYPACKQA